MDIDDDTNPFAESFTRQTTGQSFTNVRTANEYNPFTNNTAAAEPVSPPVYSSTAAYLPPSPAPAPAPVPVYQPPTYPAYPPPAAAPPSTGAYGSDPKQTSTRVDLTAADKQQAQLEEREKHLAEREKALKTADPIGTRVKNFPPFPKSWPCGPCFYQHINTEIPPEFQLWVRYAYYLWIIYSVTLLFNMIAGLSYFVTDTKGAATFGLSLVYLFLFVPLSYICWFRPLYRAFRTDSSIYFMLFFFIGIMHIITNILFAIGLIAGMCGFILIITLFNAGGNRIPIGLLALIVTLSFAMLATADCLLLIKVHRLYRQTGASLEQAQRELQTAFVNSPTVRGAAREAAAAGINEALRTDGPPQRPIH